VASRVQAFASVTAECEANGNAYGCAVGDASARAWAKATASAHAAAVAEASNVCQCQDGEAFAAAMAKGAAEFQTKIAVDVLASASGSVCVDAEGGTAAAKVSVLAKCIEKKYAYVWALAQAKALIDGNCKIGLNAEAEIKAIAAGSITKISKC
jgi:hypothetical protein